MRKGFLRFHVNQRIKHEFRLAVFQIFHKLVSNVGTLCRFGLVDADSVNYFASVDEQIILQRQAICFGFGKPYIAKNVVASSLALEGALAHAAFLCSSGSKPSFFWHPARRSQQSSHLRHSWFLYSSLAKSRARWICRTREFAGCRRFRAKCFSWLRLTPLPSF